MHTYRDNLVNMKLSSPFNDFVWRTIKQHGVYDSYLLNKVTSLGLIQENSVFIDAGSNIGNHTVYWSAANPTAKCISIEANTQIFQTLKSNVELNNLKNVNLYNEILSSTSGKFFESILEENDVGGSTVVEKQTSTDRVSKSIDDIYFDCVGFGNEPRCSFIKIDCEHHDFEVLKGACTIIDKYHPSIAIEIWPKDLCESRQKEFFGEKIRQYLGTFGYSEIEIVGVNHIYIK